MLDCVLISSDEGFRHAVMAVIKEPAAQCRLVLDIQSSADALDQISTGRIVKANPTVAFVDLGRNPSEIEGIRILSREVPDLLLIVAGPELSADGLLAVMRAGATEYLPRPFTRGEVQEAFIRVRRRVRTAAVEGTHAPGKVTTVFSAKGGTGVTTLATNLAVAMRRLSQKEVLLVDLAPSMGTAAPALGLVPRYTYLDVIQNFHRVDEDLFRSFLEHHDSGVYLLASPSTAGEYPQPSADEIHSLVRLCQKHFDHVIIDGGTTFSDRLATILQESEDRILVATPELPTLRNLKRTLDLLGRANGKAPLRIVLNQYRDGVGLSSKDVEEGLGHPVATVLENNDLAVLESINIGRPEVLAGKSAFAKHLMDLGADLIGKPRGGRSRTTLFGRLFGSSRTAGSGGKERK